MAGAAICHGRQALDPILFHQLRAFDLLMPLLIFIWIVFIVTFVPRLVPDRRRPIHSEHFFPWSDELLRIAMALEAPLHIQRRDLIGERHQIDSAVTRRAADSLVQVNAVIEIDEVGQIVHPRPSDRLACAPALANGLQVRRVRPDLRVAVHARPSRGDSRERSFLDGRVTVAAIDAVIAYVMFVAELNGLLAWKERLRVIRGSVEFQQQPDNDPDKKHRAVYSELGYVVRAAMKDLAHGLPSSEAELEKQSHIARQRTDPSSRHSTSRKLFEEYSV